MSFIKSELAEWITLLSRKDKECEQDIRMFLRLDKNLIREIRIEFEKGNIQFVQRLIKNYLDSNDKIVRTCKTCNKNHFISLNELEGMKCEKCNELLLRKSVVQERIQSPKEERRKCMYCSDPVSPLENAITCFYHRNVSFNLYE